MISYGNSRSARHIASRVRSWTSNQNCVRLCLCLVFVALSGCSSEERSRSLSNPNISAGTLALQVCSNCHGAKGISTSPNFPNLAAQSQSYLVEQLKSFRSHGRSDPAGSEYMWGVSARLSDDQIDGLASYFSSQPAPLKNARNSVFPKAGQTIYEQGISASNTPACASCHGANGEGMQLFPRLARQHADYVVKQLTVFQKTDARPEGAMMKSIAHGLTPKDMRDVAAYVEVMGINK